jgi:hypothetical protein
MTAPTAAPTAVPTPGQTAVPIAAPNFNPVAAPRAPPTACLRSFSLMKIRSKCRMGSRSSSFGWLLRPHCCNETTPFRAGTSYSSNPLLACEKDIARVFQQNSFFFLIAA